MPRARTDAPEVKAQRDRIVGRGSMETGNAVSVRGAVEVIRGKSPGGPLPPTVKDIREYAVKGITEQLTDDRVLDFRDDEVRFVGDVICEVSDLKVYGRSGMVVLNLQSTDDFLDTLTDAVRLSRGHPLFCRLYELFPKLASPWADGTHPDDPHEAIPGMPHSHPTIADVRTRDEPTEPADDWETA